MNNKLASVANEDSESKIIFTAYSNASDAYSLQGGYEIIGEELRMKIYIKRGKVTKYTFEIKKDKNNLSEIASEVVKNVLDWLSTNK